MRAIHDIGGLDGFGAVEPERHEPVFHARWEARVFAMVVAVSHWRRWSLDTSRHARETVPGYLPMTYYERWFGGLEVMLQQTGLAKTRPDGPPLRASDVSVGGPRQSPNRVSDRPARFATGQTIRTRIIDGPGHTRLPHYVQAKTGVIVAHRGAHLLPDDSARGLPVNLQPLYSVRFTARELWGPDASAVDSIYLDLWDDYIDPA